MRGAMATLNLLVALSLMVVYDFPCAAKGTAFVAPATVHRLQATTRSRCANVPTLRLQKENGSKGEFRDTFLGGLFREILPSQEEIRKAQVERMRRRDGLRGKFRKTETRDVAEEVQKKAVSRYVPPEQSPSGQQRPSIEAEQRIQFDAMREGNALNQNVILSKTLRRGG